MGSSTSQQGLQVSSPIQISQRQQNSLDERKPSASLSSYLKPALSSAGQPAGVLSTDTASVHKACAIMTILFGCLIYLYLF